MVRLTDRLREEYRRLFETCHIPRENLARVEAAADRLVASRNRYELAVEDLPAPWFFVAIVHHLESGNRFDRHLHNGDPLDQRTVRVPAGRPREGSPPFTWEESARDALRLQRIQRWEDWSLAGFLYQLERFNGFGYRLYHPEVFSPYLWSKTSHYTRGKYTADGVFSPRAVSAQIGGAALLRRMAERGVVSLPPDPAQPDRAQGQPRVRYRPDQEVEEARELQRFLNTFYGIYLRVDGFAGPRTSAAFEEVTGFRLEGDPLREIPG
ncbi:MAG: hypothetical protein AAGD01_15090 [Acidobacteriota bacterium]